MSDSALLKSMLQTKIKMHEHQRTSRFTRELKQTKREEWVKKQEDINKEEQPKIELTEEQKIAVFLTQLIHHRIKDLCGGYAFLIHNCELFFVGLIG